MSRSSSSVVVVSDSTASGGKALRFSGNSSASATNTLTSGSGLDIRARGDQCSGAPIMAVSIDGHLVGSVPVSTTSWGSYKVGASLSAGSHKVTTAFTNDLKTSTCDRNLRVDKVSVTPTVVSAPVTSPTPTPDPTPTPTTAPSTITIALASGDPSRVVFGLPTGTAKVHIYESDTATYPAASGTYDYKDISAATAASPWQPSRAYVDAIALDSTGKAIGTWFSSSPGGSRVKVTLASTTPTTDPTPTTTTTTTTTTPTPPPTTTTTTTTTTTPTPTTTTTSTTTTTTPAPAPSGFTVGTVSGPAAGWEAGLVSAVDLHPKVVRVPFDITTSVSTVQNAVAALAAKGEQALPLAEFYGRIPSTSEAQSLAGWAKAVGPGGTLWQGRSDGYLAVRYIEFGNETNEAYQFGGVASGTSYIARAQSYATRAKEAVAAINAQNPNVGLLLQGDNGGSGTSQWVDGMYSAVPDLSSRIAGWTIHPYGPKSRYGPIINQTVSDTAKHGDTSLPFFITEYGISTSNGTCLNNNYNWPLCLTYQQAADSLDGAVKDMHATYGSRLAQLFVFEQRDMGSDPSAREDNFGAVKMDGSTKGAFTTEFKYLTNTYRG